MVPTASFKTIVYRYYQDMVGDRIATLQAGLQALQESLQQETKSTAGDKYETARAMLHIEQEQLTRQLSVLLQQKAILDSLDIPQAQQHAGPGSLIGTDKGYFLLGAALGKALIEGHTVFAISPTAPLGKKLLGCREGQYITLNGQTYKIESLS